MDDKEQAKFQQKLYLYQILVEQQKLFTQQLVAVEQAIEESITTEEVIRDLEKKESKEILASLGKDCFIKVGLKDQGKVIVDLGAGVLANKTLKEALGILESRRKELEKNIGELEKRMENVSRQIEKLEPDMQKILGSKD
ncbi:MAG: prefoldin subunit alpha [archaeon]|nr:MAG: prefoldin subunit alpha [archaeon]